MMKCPDYTVYSEHCIYNLVEKSSLSSVNILRSHLWVRHGSLTPGHKVGHLPEGDSLSLTGQILSFLMNRFTCV